MLHICEVNILFIIFIWMQLNKPKWYIKYYIPRQKCDFICIVYQGHGLDRKWYRDKVIAKSAVPSWGVMLQRILVCIPKRNLDVSSQRRMPVGRPWLMAASDWCRWIVVDDCCNSHSTVWSWHSQFPSQWSQMTTHSLLTSYKDNIMHVFSLSQKGPLNVQSSAIITPSNIVGYYIITGTESEYQSDP